MTYARKRLVTADTTDGTEKEDVTGTTVGTKRALDVNTSAPYDADTIEASKSMAADFNSTAWDVSDYRYGSLTAEWSGIDATNSTMILEGSNTGGEDEEEWAEFGGDEGGVVILDTQDASQVWEFTVFTMRYVRLAYKANNVSTGTVTIKGYGKS
jgi:hypothetical protein